MRWALAEGDVRIPEERRDVYDGSDDEEVTNDPHALSNYCHATIGTRSSISEGWLVTPPRPSCSPAVARLIPGLGSLKVQPRVRLRPRPVVPVPRRVPELVPRAGVALLPAAAGVG